MKANSWTVLRFLVVGAFNTLVGLTVIIGAKWLLGMGDVSANVAGYGFGLMFSFFANRRWTFEHQGSRTRAGLRFAATFIVAYSANLAAMFLLRDSVGMNSYLAQTGAVVPYTVLFYLGCRFYVFPVAQGRHWRRR